MRTWILQAVTSLHVGEGTAVGAVDLPLMRERHTGWPCIAGSSIKGALRDRARLVGLDQDANYLEAFGREPDGTEVSDDLARAVASEAGRVRFGTAVLLALPLRSLRGTFVLATCPMALMRFARLLDDPPDIPQPGIDQVRVAPKTADGGLDIAFPTGGGGEGSPGVAALEEIAWVVRPDTKVSGWTDFLEKICGEDAPLDHLAVIHDDVFAHAARYWTPTRTRNCIGEDGVVEDAKLYSTESLAPEALLWGQVDGLDGFEGLLPDAGETWWLGGHRTTGSGRVAAYWRQP